MTSRRKAKRADWIYYPPKMFVLEENGFRKPLKWPMKWYETKTEYVPQCSFSHPEKMWGCVKKSKQQKHRGSWNLVGVDPWYSKGYIKWKRD